MKSSAVNLGTVLIAATLMSSSAGSQSQSDFQKFFLEFKSAVMSADTYQLQDLMASQFDFMEETNVSPGDVFRGLGSGQWPNLQSAVRNKMFITQTYKGKPARFLRCTPETVTNNCYVIFQTDSSKLWRWKAMIMPDK